MRWPWPKSEVRESSYTDVLVGLLTSQAAGTAVTSLPAGLAALETSAGMLGRALASSRLQGPPWIGRALPAPQLAQLGRSLIRNGQWVALIDIEDGYPVLRPAASHDVTGPAAESAWKYRLDLQGPSGTATYNAPREQVVHVKWATDPSRPWRGVSPLEVAVTSGRLAAAVTGALADEAGGPTGSLLPTPKDGKDPTIVALRGEIGGLRGRMATVESQSQNWSSSERRTPSKEWEPRRLGADPPTALIQLLELAEDAVFGACGVPLSLVRADDGAGQREAYRRWMHTCVQPAADIIAAELSAGFDAEISLDLGSLFASDLAGKSRAWGILVKNGMDRDAAARLTGLDS